MAEYQSYRVLAGRIRMRVLDWPGADPPVLFIHGFSNNALAALNLGKLLVDQRRVIAPDLRGRGSSDMPFGEYGIPMHLRDIMACMNRLGVQRFVVAGHSLGATIGVFLAAQFPERITGLILFDGGAIPSPLAMEALSVYYDTIKYRYPSIEAYVDRFRSAPAYQPWTDEMEELVRSNLFEQPDGSYLRKVARYVIDADRHAEQGETWKQLPDLYPRIECPTLILRAGMGMVGVEDRVLSDDVIVSMRAGIPSSRVVSIERAGHTSLLTIPSEERDAAILEFLGLK